MLKNIIIKFKKYGFKEATKRGVKKIKFMAKKYVVYPIGSLIFRHFYLKHLKSILSKTNYKKIIVLYPGCHWYMKLKQRPQHIADYLSKKGYLYFYCTNNNEENFRGFKEIQNNLYVTNQYKLLSKTLKNYYLHVYANWNITYEEIKELENNNIKIIYEHVDEFTTDLFPITENMYKRHDYVIKNKNIIVIATATRLYNDVVEQRGSNENVILSTNGVNLEDFFTDKLAIDIPIDMMEIISKNKKIIGYYGAFGSWFDTDIVIKLAKTNKYSIVLIGVLYERTYESMGFSNYENIYYLGPKKHVDLINYAKYFDVSIIPFLINEITLSTSPVKLFEYMAIGHPIVTTDMPECRKYQSVLIGKTHDEFIEKIEKAVTLKNDEIYATILQKEAKENSWKEKVKEIVKLIEKH